MQFSFPRTIYIFFSITISDHSYLSNYYNLVIKCNLIHTLADGFLQQLWTLLSLKFLFSAELMIQLSAVKTRGVSNNGRWKRNQIILLIVLALAVYTFVKYLSVWVAVSLFKDFDISERMQSAFHIKAVQQALIC